jgi:hypothetical protein
MFASISTDYLFDDQLPEVLAENVYVGAANPLIVELPEFGEIRVSLCGGQVMITVVGKDDFILRTAHEESGKVIDKQVRIEE